jgi:hypothetical protein
MPSKHKFAGLSLLAGEAGGWAFQPQGQAEQRGVLLLSVPYARKAGDAQTLGGLPGYGLRAGRACSAFIRIELL